MVILLSLPVSLLVSSLRLDIKLTPTSAPLILPVPEFSEPGLNRPGPVYGSTEFGRHFVMRLLSRNRNLTIVEQNGHLFADSLPIASLIANEFSTLYIRCLNDVLLRISISNSSKMMLSPSLCQRNSQLKVQFDVDETEEQVFDGCIENVTVANEVLLDRWCSIDQQRAQSDGPRPPPPNIEPFYAAEPLRLDEGATVAIKWRNIYIFPHHSRYTASNGDIHFRLVESPQHGQLLKEGQIASEFTYSDILKNKVYYKHDDSETTVDNIDLEVNITSKTATAPKLRTTINSIPVRINPVNDAPDIKPGGDPEALRVSGELKLKLDSRVINLWDADSDPDTVYVTVIDSHGVRLENLAGEEIRKFTQRDFLNDRIRIARTGKESRGMLKVIASDGERQSDVLELTLRIVPIEIQLKANTGLKVMHQSAAIISSANLTFRTNLPGVPIEYTIVELPEYGAVECRNEMELFEICSMFTQTDIDSSRVRYKHSSAVHPLLDSFSFQHIDDEEITYKMHFVQYSIVNDFFVFRLIAPSVASEEVRFEITYIPGHGSIHLNNRTVIVNEGGIQKITNESLSLQTPDDSNFVFTIGVAPAYGNILVSGATGAKYTLSDGDNFTTSDINAGRVFYEHMDGENRVDRVFLVAESAYRRASRVPFWLTIRMIMKNDNIPRLAGSNIIQITERGDRILYPSLLPWIDDDIDAQPLQFIFHGGFRHAAISSKFMPTVPLQNFTQRQMQNGEILMRHFGHSRKFKMNYTVSDGVHEVHSALTVVASEPFVRFQNSTITVPSSNTVAALLIPVTNQNLSAVTNVDSKNSDISFRVSTGGNWILVRNSTEILVKRFTQQDIDEGRLFYRTVTPSDDDQQLITVTVANLTASETIKIFKSQQRENQHHLEIRKLAPLTVPLSSISQIDKNVLMATAADKQPSEIVFDIIRHPTHGSLILESLKAANNGRTVTPSDFYVSRFTQAHVNAGQIQYLHSGVLPARDSIVFNVSVEKQKIGPYTLFINVVDDEIELFVTNVTVVSGSSKVLNSGTLRATTVGENGVEFRVFSDPESGWLVRDTWNLTNITTIKQFSAEELADNRIHYINNPSSREQTDRFAVAACTTGTLRCTEPKQVIVVVRYRNLHEPELLRNEVLKMWNAHKAPITKQHLFSQDDDTPAENVRYLISQPLNGFVARVNNPSKAVTNFSQAEISKSEILFVKNGDTAAAGGFSFLISDGLHQIGPEWFTVESPQRIKIAMDANGRLVVPPGRFPTVIGSDLLKVQIPDVKSQKIYYSVTKTPRFGHLLLSGIPTQKFTQEDINQLRLTYKPDSDFLDEWTKRDLFLFKVFTNETTDNSAIDEHRYKISITYAALPSHRLHEFIQLRSVIVSRGGSVAINGSHINMDVLTKHCRDELLVDISRKPRYGRLDILDQNTNQSTLVKVIHLLTGRSLIYRHQKEESMLPDEILLNIVPKNDANRRTNRLRVILPVILIPQKDTHIKIAAFPDRIKLIAGGDYFLAPKIFQATHPEIPSTGLDYRLLQAGSNGVKLFKRDGMTEVFTQQDINNGKIRFSHQQRFDTHDHVDVIVLQIGDHIRTLVVDILPLSLSLSNHSDIEYVQGKTYVVLNKTHFGANSNGDRSKIVYKITKAPENGTFYWVAGEKEVNTFTQRDIDEERVLYAQLNMQAFQDRFEFAVGNDLKDTIRNSSYVRVLPVLTPRTLIVHASYITSITATHLNASILEGSAPRFLVTEAPRFGRLVMSTNVNDSVVFFTYNDIVNSRVFFVPFETDVTVHDFAELQLDADDIQPARFRFNIEISPSSGIDQQMYIPATEGTSNLPPSPELPELPTVPAIEPVNHHVPIILLLLIVAVTIFILVFRRHTVQQKRLRLANAQKKREYDAKMEANFEKQPDLLGSTVYATIGRNRLESTEKRPLRPMQTFDGSRRYASWASSPVPQRPHFRALSGGSLDYRSLSARNTPELNRSRPDRYHSTKLKENQYWV